MRDALATSGCLLCSRALQGSFANRKRNPDSPIVVAAPVFCTGARSATGGTFCKSSLKKQLFGRRVPYSGIVGLSGLVRSKTLIGIERERALFRVFPQRQIPRGGVTIRTSILRIAFVMPVS